ncbi:aldehyde dehydrogenase [Tieghemostelium lacteum]|uniref:Aldehyde dehydrogenase n=1 Tax=Tieghemostelium lacteum TaxID=361077 RepID=A0A151Z943_TIELA|nr:aldehyde dehydrogenase [Tieghemostelium lacteum]|eukprot:KYQ90465.1 aldehyde dehydrogenase [Tieghemostelium lacteum]
MIEIKGKGNETIKVNTQVFINNEWSDGVNGNSKKEKFQLINPATEEVMGEYFLGDSTDVDTAVKAARNAYNSKWKSMNPSDRGILLYKLADLIEKHRHVLAVLESVNVGKPYGESYYYDLKQTINTYRYFAGWADKLQGNSIPIGHMSANAPTFALTRHVPLGVVGLILPWNLPLQLLTWKLAPCLATGNTVVIKPSEFTPLTTWYLANLIKEAGFPPGVVNVIAGNGVQVGNAISSHMDINKVGFTGSTKIGKLVQVSATNSNLKHVSLELGGKSPVIVFSDTKNPSETTTQSLFEKAIVDSYHGLFWNAGQCCSAGSRIYVQEQVYDEFVQRMHTMVKNRVLGDPLDSKTDQGPQVNKFQMESVLRYCQIGQNEGARLVCGGKRHGTKGYYIEPTIFADVQDHMTIAREEIFGPVMCIFKFKTISEVIERANNSIYGLVGSVFTRDFNTSLVVSEQLDVGLVWVNSFNIIDATIPWGGTKQSGIGRDLSQYCLNQYTETKSIILHSNL